MKSWIGFRMAGGILLAGLFLLLVMHILVLAQIIPHEMIWAGQITDERSFYQFEGMAIVVTLLFMGIVFIRFKGHGLLKRSTTLGLWCMAVYFVLNTLGNIASGITTERLFFTPVSIMFALLALRMAAEKDQAR